jgi:hypothetical protein
MVVEVLLVSVTGISWRLDIFGIIDIANVLLVLIIESALSKILILLILLLHPMKLYIE